MKKLLIIIAFFSSIGLAFSQRSVIKGQLYWMSPDNEFKPQEQNIPYHGIPLEVYVHQLTTEAEVDYTNGKITKIYTPVATRFFCKSNGSFKARIPPGQYSVFVRYKNAYHGNLKDRDGNISPAIITDAKKSAWITVTLEY